MLGIADRGLVFDLIEAALKATRRARLERMNALYEGGADPVMVLQDLLELVHFLTRLKLSPAAGEGDPALEGERGAWPGAGRSISAFRRSPAPGRCCSRASARRSPRRRRSRRPRWCWCGSPMSPTCRRRPSWCAALDGAPCRAHRHRRSPPRIVVTARALAACRPQRAAPAALPQPVPAPAPLPEPQSFLDVVELFDQHREAVLRSHLYANVHLVHFEPGRIELRPTEAAPRDLSNRLGQLLTQWTGQRWVVSVSAEPGEPTLREAGRRARDGDLRSEAAQHPLVRAVLETFPGARIEAVRDLAPPEPAHPEPIDGADERSEGDDTR